MGILPSNNIAAHLPLRAEQQPYQLAALFPHGRDHQGRVAYTHYTFRQLNEESDRLAHGLAAVGVRRGVRTVLMVRPSLEFFALAFALFKVGAVLVLVDPGMGIRNLGQCLAEAEPAAFIGIPKAQLARRLFGWARRTLRIHITVGRRLLWGGLALSDIRGAGGATAYAPAPTAAEETAAILFTSGSTGVPKGAVYTHAMFAAQVEMLRQTYTIEPGEIDLGTFPLFALFAPALGMTEVVPDMDATRPAQVDPRRIIEAIHDFGVTNLFGSPALLHRVAHYGVRHNVRLPSLRRVISAGAPVPARVLEQMAMLLPTGTQTFTPYGATESLPITSIGSCEIIQETRALTDRGGGVCVGRPVAGMEVTIIPIREGPIETWSDALRLPAGEIGEIAVKGPVVTREYYGRPEATLLAKIRAPQHAPQHAPQDAPQHGGFYHRMGDLGYVDERGRLWFCGRKSQRVRTSTETLFTIPCEAIFNTHPAVYRTALVGVGSPGAARPVLCVELQAATQPDQQRETQRRHDHGTIRRELLALGAAHAHTRAITTILFHPGFPVDIRHNAKIFREKLAGWAARRV